MFKQEWKNLFHNHWLKIVLVAIILIPSIYACVFLGSMWDPYGNSGDLPVAVVNKDQAVTYNDKELDVGNQMVEKLKDNDSLDFHFVDEEEAQKGLEDGSYYMIITIPSDFSKNATTLLNEHPDKMVLQYTTNPGTNYVASKMDDSAIAKIKESISATVTKTYAETLFESVKTLSNGLQDASDGTSTLLDGMNQLVNGNTTISDNLQVLANSTLTFKDGSSTLENGLQSYTDGVLTVHNGVYSLKNGITTLNEATPSLSNGINQLNSGASALNSGIQSYTNGVSQALAGANQLTQNNTTLTNGATALGKGANDLVQGNQQVVDGLKTVSTQLQASLSTENQEKLTAALNGNAQLDSATTLLNTFAQIDAKKLSETAYSTKWITSKLNTDDIAFLSQINPVFQQNQIKGLLMTHSYTDIVTAVTSGNQAAINTLTAGLTELNTAVNGGTLSDGTETKGLLAGSQTVQAGLNNVAASVNGGTYINENGTTKEIPAEQSLVNGIAAYTQGVSQLQAGLSTLASNNNSLTSGSTALANGTQSLATQTPTLVNGIQQLNDGANQLYAGTSTLTANNSTLMSGIQQLDNGALQISDGASQLASGSHTLGDGLKSALEGTTTLNTALSDGAKESKINTNDETTDMVSTPVEVDHKEISTVENNGHAMAPYMMSVALYVAALAFTLMYPIRHGIKNVENGFKYWLAKASVMYTVSTISAIVMVTGLKLINGFEPQQLMMTYLFAIIVAAAFMSLVMLLSLTTGFIGEFLLLVFMIINLGGSAGTYPLDTSAAIYKIIHPFVPYTYSVNGFRKVISYTTCSLSTELAVFIGIFVICSILTVVYYQFKNKEDKHLVNEVFEKVNEQ